MIYLNNNTNPQEIWIPKQNGFGSAHTSKTYQEGYEDGIEHQKELLASTAFTENGLYTREDGWNEVDVSVPAPALEEKTVVISADTTNIVPSSGYYGMSAVTIDAADYAQQSYDDGFDDGFIDGMSSGYTDGYNSGYTSGYTSGSTDGFDSGYTSGETHQKSLLTTTAITENGNYTRADGWSGISVNVPTGSSLNIETNKPFTATSNGNYTITPTSASTTVNTEYIPNQYGSGTYILTAYTQGYPSVGLFNLIKVYRESNPSDYAILYYRNGSLGYNISEWGGSSVNLYDNVYSFYFVGNDCAWSSLEDYTFSYDVMSAVSLNVNVDTASTYQSGYTSGYTSGHTDGVDEEKAKMSAVTFTANTAVTLSDGSYSAITVNVPQSGGSGTTFIFPADYIHSSKISDNNKKCKIDTGIYPTTATTFRVKGMHKGKEQNNIIVGYSENDNTDYRIFWAGSGGRSIFFDFNNSRINTNMYSFVDGYEIDLECGNYYVQSGDGTTILTGSQQSTIDDPHTILVDAGSWWLKSLEIWDGNTKVFDGISAYDENGNIGLYDSVSKSLLTPTNSAISMTYEIVSTQLSSITITANTAITSSSVAYTGITVNVPQTGHTDQELQEAYNSGYTSGSTDVISTFSSTTATTNGVYGSSAHPLSSITVNVPTSGGPVISLVDYVHTDILSDNANDKYLDTGIIPTTATTFRVQGMTKGYGQGNVIVGYMDNINAAYRLFWWNWYYTGSHLTFDFNNQRIDNEWGGSYDGRIVDITCSNYQAVSGNGTTLMSGTTQTTIDDPHTILIDVGSWWAKSLEIWDNGVKVFDGQAAIDSDGNIGLYDSISQSMVYNSGLTMAYEGTPVPIPSADYQSGYTDGYSSGYTSGYTSGETDGYNSGYTSGRDDGYDMALTDVENASQTLSVSANGTYNTSLRSGSTYGGFSGYLWDEVIVNVPQTAVTVDLNPAFIDRSITDIIVPTACTKVGRAAFSHCESARTITIPDTVTFIDVDGFSHCHRVTGITFGNGIKIIGAQAFEHCGDLLAQGETINNGHIILPDSVEKIGDDAFYDIDVSVTAITFGSGTTNLGDDIIAGTNIQEIYSYALTAPQRQVHIITSGGTHYEYYTFRGINATGTVHYPTGSDYSSWQNDQYLSGWTFVSDL